MLMVENDWYLIAPSLPRVAVGLGALSFLFKHVVEVSLYFCDVDVYRSLGISEIHKPNELLIPSSFFQDFDLSFALCPLRF